MKKVSPLSVIPTTPKTLSGQLLQFNHMANHYRRLANAKPSINTNSGRNWNAPQKIPSLASALKPSKSKKVLKKLAPKKTQSDNINGGVPLQRPKVASKMLDFGYQTLMNATGEEVGYSLTPENQGYQLIFGPEQIHNLSEAVMSESEPDEPHVHQMDMEEKINRYLSQLKFNDEQGSPLNSPTSRFIPGPFKHLIQNPKSRAELQESYRCRHTNCFHYASEDEECGPRCPRKSGTASKISEKSSAVKKKVNNSDVNNNKSRKPSLGSKLSGSVSKGVNSKTSNTKAPAKALSKTTISKVGVKGSKSSNAVDRTESPASAKSFGTVRGSEDLEMEFLERKSQLKSENSKTLVQDMDENDLLWLERLQKYELPIQKSSSASNTAVTKPSSRINSGTQSQHNKDSSHDSAYGFSSGESRITTRESTPEKTNKYRTNASSINQDISPGQSLQYSNSNDKSSRFMDSLIYSPRSPRKLMDSATNWKSDVRYLNFLTSVTDDIVKRGIYTNKGIKNAFQSHIRKHPELEVDKMIYMLDRLRMDVGVPKEESLDSIDFGYGAIKYSVGPFFYDPTLTAALDNGNEESSELPIKSRVKFNDNPSAPPLKLLQNRPSSEVSVYEHFHRDFSGGENSSKQSSCNVSVINGGPNQQNKSCSSSARSSGTNFSLGDEPDIRRALMEAGFDMESTSDILEIIGRPVSNRSIGSASSSSKHNANVDIPNVRVPLRSSSATSVNSV